MTTAPATIPIRRATMHVANPQAEPSDAWVRAVAVMLLAAADRKIANQHQHRDQDQDAP